MIFFVAVMLNFSKVSMWMFKRPNEMRIRMTDFPPKTGFLEVFEAADSVCHVTELRKSKTR